MTGSPTHAVTYVAAGVAGTASGGWRERDEYSRLVREAATRAGGTEVEQRDESVLFVFEAAPDAFAAAVRAQRAARVLLGPAAEVRLVVGLHSGGASREDRARATAVAALAEAGQILVSAETRRLVEHALPEGVALRRLGRAAELVYEATLAEPHASPAVAHVAPARMGRSKTAWALRAAVGSAVLAAAATIAVFMIFVVLTVRRLLDVF